VRGAGGGKLEEVVVGGERVDVEWDVTSKRKNVRKTRVLRDYMVPGVNRVHRHLIDGCRDGRERVCARGAGLGVDYVKNYIEDGRRLWDRYPSCG